MTTSSIWRSRPVFITSTFRDMHAERDWLRVHVSPFLEERLRKRFHHLETVDLRWSVDSASAEQEQDRELVVLTACLREIERNRPFLIGLLGDRYGWRPPGVRITAAAREAGLDADVAGQSVTASLRHHRRGATRKTVNGGTTAAASLPGETFATVPRSRMGSSNRALGGCPCGLARLLRQVDERDGAAGHLRQRAVPLFQRAELENLRVRL